jgi:hypothetical protein
MAVLIITTQHSWTNSFLSGCNGAFLAFGLSTAYVIIGICEGDCDYYVWSYFYIIALTIPVGFVLGALVGWSNHESRKAASDKRASTMPLKEEIVNGLINSAPNKRLWAAKKARDTARFNLESVRHILVDIAANDINDDVRHEAQKTLNMHQKHLQPNS